MIFEVQKNWEIRTVSADVYKTFSIVKFGFNEKCFLLDVVTEEVGGDVFTERYEIGTIKDTLAVLAENKFKDSTITLFLPRCENSGEYLLTDILKIIEAKDEAGQTAHIFDCKNGKRYIDSDLANSEDELTDFNTIYFKNLS